MIHGERHAALATSYNNFRDVYSNLGEHSKTKEHFEKALGIKRRICSEKNNHDVERSYNHLGIGYNNLGQHIIKNITKKHACIEH